VPIRNCFITINSETNVLIVRRDALGYARGNKN